VLLERAAQLASLAEFLDDVVAESRGRLVPVAGEAGIGKTALLRTFCDEHSREARMVWGACDPLFAPRPLGPFLEVAEATGGRVEEVVTSGGMPYDLAVALVRELGGRTPTVWSSRTCTGRTKRRSTCCASSSGGCNPSP